LVSVNGVLMATYELVWKKNLVLKITISEGAKNKYSTKPMWIDSER
jgi:hypothetical protein